MNKVETPTLDRMLELREDGTLNTLTEFYDWLKGEALTLTRWDQLTETEDCPRCSGAGFNMAPNPDRNVGWSTSVPATIEVTCRRCDGACTLTTVVGEGWVKDRRRPEQLFADFLGIDMDEVERERRALLDAQRELNKEKENA